MDSPTDSQFASWTTPECPFAIEYSLRVLDDIRLAVMDAFFSLPRGGAEIGGILLGTFDKRVLRIADYAPLDCEHAYGPSFTLSDRDHAKLEELLTIARRSGGSLGPVGWYHSHTRSEVFFSDADIAIHKHFFPEPWQIGLVLKPHTFEPMRAGFFFREAGGKVHGEACYREFKLDPQLPMQAAAAAAGVSPAALPPPPPAPVLPRIEPPVIVMPERTEPVEPLAPAPPDPVPPAAPAPVSAPAPVAEPVEVPLPAFAVAEEPAPRRLKWVVLALVAAAASAAGAYQTRSAWLPPAQAALARFTAKPAAPAPAPRPQQPPPPVAPPATLGLNTVDQEGQLHITWNRDAAVVRGAAGGILAISEGPAPLVIPLDQAHLQNGSFTYGRESGRVDVSLTVEAANGQSTKEVATFVGAPVQRSKAQDAAVLKQRDDLAKQAEKLKSDLKKQAERTRKLENTVDQMRLEIIRQQRTRMQNMSPDAPKAPAKQ
jgi:proteasome lid subunit RPN8/RPN11